MPSDVKVLRKSLLACRDMIDIFSFAYPNSTKVSGKKRDVWYKIREDFDQGYTLVGNFQDLNHSGIDYNQTELIHRRKACLDWKDTFSSHSSKFKYDIFILHPSTTELFYRPVTDLSAYYWEFVDIYPSFSKTGLENIALLEQKLVNLAEKNFTQLNKVEHPYDTTQHTFFHDYRKLMRSITTIQNYFNVIKNTACVSGALTTLNNIYDKLGNINDEVVAFDYYEQHKENSKAQSMKQKIDQNWADFISWVHNQQMAYQFECLLATIMLSNTRHLAGNRFLATTNAGAQTPTKHLVLRVFAD